MGLSGSVPFLLQSKVRGVVFDEQLFLDPVVVGILQRPSRLQPYIIALLFEAAMGTAC
jgi:hypothetical protein